MKKALTAFLIVVVLVLVSCATKLLLSTDGQWFQKLPADGSYVVTVSDADLLQSLVSLDSRLVERIDRASVSIGPDGWMGIIEGDIPVSLFKAGMLFSPDFNRKKGEDWYSDSGNTLKFSAIQDGLVILTDGDFGAARETAASELNPVYIDDETAELMASSQIALYSFRPQVLPAIQVLQDDFDPTGIRNLLIWVAGDRLNMIVDFETEQLAQAFSKLLRLSYISRLKRAEQPVVVSELKQQLILEGKQVRANGLYMAEGEVGQIVAAVRF